ncbi:hypothetical protein ACJD0Z_17435 [Flavobacteriaceae bacterium M23B6Z8]
MSTIQTHLLDNTALKTHMLENIKALLQKQQIAEPHIQEILNEEFIARNPEFYLYYPFLFNTLFDYYNEELLTKIAIAGFLYYKSIIFLDDIFDNAKSQNKFYKYIIANICQEETIKILTDIFGSESEFWSLWNLRKMEYAKAFKIGSLDHEKFDYPTFETLTDYKCAFGKIGIDALHILTGKRHEKVYKNVLESHKLFYIAFQITDDVTDFKEDIENKQQNLAGTFLKNHFDANDHSLDQYTVSEQNKLIYLEGVVTKLYQIALQKIKEAESIFNQHQNSLWFIEILRLRFILNHTLLNTNGFLNHREIVRNQITDRVSESLSLEKAIEAATTFIFEEQETDGSWQDYFNNAGISNVWTTAFVLTQLSGIEQNEFKQARTKALKFLMKNENEDGLFGYNDLWISDADSSTFSFLALKKNRLQTPQDLDEWLTYQNEDGGFSTYKITTEFLISIGLKDPLEAKGWIKSHPCVSAAAYYFLSHENASTPAYERLRSYLYKNLNAKSTLSSYWWTESLYTLYYLLKGTQLAKDTEMQYLCEDMLAREIDKMLAEIAAEKRLNFFYLGLLIQTLMTSDKMIATHKSSLAIFVDALLSNQYTDGSWPSNFSLRMPEPSTTNPEEINDWKKDTVGINILVEDFHRIFTTSVCLAALDSYANL